MPPPRSAPARLVAYLRRVLHPRVMDFEQALWAMFHLAVAPRRVYRNIYYHKQTTNRWARDDPAFVVILAGCLAVSAIAYGIAYSRSVSAIVGGVFFAVCVDFILAGLLISLALWAFANKFLVTHSPHSPPQAVEFAYAFDVHTNGFFILFVVNWIVVFFFIPILRHDNYVSKVLGNTFYLASWTMYWYLTFLGYQVLPFLRNTVVFLVPIAVGCIAWLVGLFGFSMYHIVSSAYFGAE